MVMETNITRSDIASTCQRPAVLETPERKQHFDKRARGPRPPNENVRRIRITNNDAVNLAGSKLVYLVPKQSVVVRKRHVLNIKVQDAQGPVDSCRP